ncbi:MAG: GGDEF domain-containing protein [Euzebyales bacterium]|nr:GGDEF domain-containing protein [Euzebyales bacterium]MBA3622487.1 GGDEF domain-containing protein [Euzebyales bacterium]
MFNVGQYVLSLSAAGAVMRLVAGHTALLATLHLDGVEYVALVAAGVTIFTCNVVLTGVALALRQGAPMAAFLREDFHRNTATGAALALAPAIVVLASLNLALVLLLLLPAVAIDRNARAALAKDHLALHDNLTDLPNRRLFVMRVELALRSARRDGGQVAVLLVDLDRFKEVNDTLGHHTGDRVLQAVARRLSHGGR